MRRLIAIICAAVLGLSLAACDSSTSGQRVDPAPPATTATDELEKALAAAEEALAEEDAALAPIETVSQQNARESAESYIQALSFSRSGLIHQLRYEGFSKADAEYGVNAIHPNWNNQAALSAQSYLESQSFSRQGLIDQLKYEGFTAQQAVYGVTRAGL